MKIMAMDAHRPKITSSPAHFYIPAAILIVIPNLLKKNVTLYNYFLHRYK